MGIKSTRKIESYYNYFANTSTDAAALCDPYDPQSGCYAPTPVDWGGDRGVWAGGVSPSYRNTIDYLSITSGGAGTDFGDLQATKYDAFGLSNGSRGVFGGGYTGSNPGINVIGYITIASPGNATDFGDLSVARYMHSALSNGTRGCWGGGWRGSGYGNSSNVIDYITIASTGNATDFGDLTVARGHGLTGVCNGTRGCFAGGRDDSAGTNVIDYITVASTGNATDFGDLTGVSWYNYSADNETYGVICLSYNSDNDATLNYITIASTGNAADFGDMSQARRACGGCTNGTRGAFGGGQAPGITDRVDYINISSPGNSVDFADLTQARTQAQATSGD